MPANPRQGRIGWREHKRVLLTRAMVAVRKGMGFVKLCHDLPLHAYINLYKYDFWELYHMTRAIRDHPSKSNARFNVYTFLIKLGHDSVLLRGKTRHIRQYLSHWLRVSHWLFFRHPWRERVGLPYEERG